MTFFQDLKKVLSMTCIFFEYIEMTGTMSANRAILQIPTWLKTTQNESRTYRANKTRAVSRMARAATTCRVKQMTCGSKPSSHIYKEKRKEVAPLTPKLTPNGMFREWCSYKTKPLVRMRGLVFPSFYGHYTFTSPERSNLYTFSSTCICSKKVIM